MADLEVHRTHCCKIHGCKYCDADCPVEHDVVKQGYPCEMCSEYGTDVFFKKNAPIVTASQLVEFTLRSEITKLLKMLPKHQNEVFQKCLAPGKTLETTEEDKLRGLYDLCVRSVHAHFAPKENS
jgi:hypothetical protein